MRSRTSPQVSREQSAALRGRRTIWLAVFWLLASCLPRGEGEWRPAGSSVPNWDRPPAGHESKSPPTWRRGEALTPIDAAQLHRSRPQRLRHARRAVKVTQATQARAPSRTEGSSPRSPPLRPSPTDCSRRLPLRSACPTCGHALTFECSEDGHVCPSWICASQFPPSPACWGCSTCCCESRWAGCARHTRTGAV